MGQGYIALEAERNEYVHPAVFGSGAKRSAIIRSGVSTVDALAILLADPGRRNRRPADVHTASRTGRWAGKRVVLQGEHGQAGDSPNWPSRGSEADAYRDARERGFEMGASMVRGIHRVHGMAPGYIRTRCDGRTIVTPVTIGLRQEDGRLVVDEASNPGPHLERIRQGVGARVAGINPDTYVIDAWDGARRVIADLDRREYVDPEQLAEIPTIAGMMRGHLKRWSRENPESMEHHGVTTSLGLLACLLFKADLEDPRMGRWRGDRILVSNEESAGWPTTPEIRGGREWRDVTPELTDGGIDWMLFHGRREDQRYGDIAPETSCQNR